MSMDRQADGFQLASIMYGHTARIWDCHLDSKFLITVSEDCTYCIWTIDGKPLVKKIAHLGRGIWRCVYDSANAVLFTAGADSSIKVHFLGKWLSGTNQVGKGEELSPKYSPFLESFCLGSQEDSVNCKKKEQLDSKSEYVRCLSLVGATCLYIATNQGVLKCVHFTQGGQETWVEVHSNLNSEPIFCLDILRLQKKIQKYTGIDAFEDWIVMGDSKGYVTVLCGSWFDDLFHESFFLRWPAEGERKLLGVFWSRHSGISSVFTADTCGALSMWSLKDTLARSSEGELIYDKFSNSPGFSEGTANLGSSLAIRYQSSFNARIVCLDTCPTEELLVCGDQRGNIVVFNLPSAVLPKNMQPFPLVSFKGAHGISAVASVCFCGNRNEEQIKICSTGRDGCICTFALEKSVASLICLRVEKVSAVTVVESCILCNGITRGAPTRTIVAGFLAEDFLIYDQQNDCEILRVPCGGWRRPHAYLIGDFPELQYCFVFIKDGVINVSRKWLVTPDVSSPLVLLPVANRSSLSSSFVLQSQFHGREVHSVNFIANGQVFRDQISSTSWIATGAEDGVVRIMRFNEDTLEHFDVSQVLGEHVGGSAIREVISVTGYSLCNGHCPPSVRDATVVAEPSSILISVGAKEILTCWLLEWEDGIGQTRLLSSRWLSTKRYMRRRKTQKMAGMNVNIHVQDDGKEKQDVLALEHSDDDDLRYLAVTSFSIFCPQTRLQTFFAATASSNATVVLHAFQVLAGNWVELCFLDYHKAPVLTLQHLVIPEIEGAAKAFHKLMVFSGATDGSIAVWDVTDIVSKFCHKQLGQGNVRMFRPPSGRGSQGGRRWKLSRCHLGDQEQLLDGTNNTNVDDMETVEEVSHYDRHCDVETLQAANHSREGFYHSHTIKPELVLPFAHQSGVNSMSVSSVKCEQDNDQMWVVVSGGDDQGLHVAICKVGEVGSSPTKIRANMVCLCEVSIPSAHSSAVKGVWTDGFFVFTTGWDQRLRVWKLEVLKHSCSLVECCQTVINVPEPAAIHAEQLLRRNYRIAIAGRGLQVFKVKGN